MSTLKVGEIKHESFTGTTQLKLDSAGNVGIGTTSPDQSLHIYHATDNGLLHLESGDSQARIKLKDNAGETHLGAVGNDTVFWQTSSLNESMRIDSSGNVGIGISSIDNSYSASHKLQIASVSDNNWAGSLVLSSADGSSVFSRLVASTNGLDFINTKATNLRFFTSNTERMRTSSTGELLINKTSSDSANHLLQLYAKGTDPCNGRITTGGMGSNADLAWSAGASNRDAAFGIFKNASNNPGSFMRMDTEDDTTTYAWFDNNRTFRVSGAYQDIGTTGGTVVGSQSSDIRLKDLVDDGSVSYGLSEINQITPIKFKYKKDPRTNSDISNGDVIKTRIGFSAQQVKPIIPEAVYDTNEQVEGEDNIMAMEYISLIPALVNAVKELSTKIDLLQTKVAALEAK